MHHSQSTQSTQSDCSWRARALIDLDSLHHNLSEIRRAAPQSQLMAVIKADAYGHGLETVCQAIHKQVDAFAVATIAEGIQCRQVQADKPVVVLSELWQQAQLQNFEQYGMHAVVHNEQQVKWLAEYRGKPISVWIKFDSGMNRLGVDADAVSTIYKKLQNASGIKNIRLMSHLANADVVGDDFTSQQLAVFKRVADKIKCEKSLANSAGVMGWPATHFSWIRPGLMLYGAATCRPQGDKIPKFDLKPVMQLQARLIAVKTIAAEQPVGYDGIFRTRRVSKIAMVGLGYGDGYPRLEDARACVLIANQRAPIIGRVSMDMITVDVTELDSVKIGEQVTLWGHGLSIEEVAQWAGTIPHELLCKVTTRIPRLPVKNSG